MNVYIVSIDYDHEAGDIDSVYESREQAEQRVAELELDASYRYNWFSIVEKELVQCQQHHKHSEESSGRSDEALSSSVDTVVNGSESANLNDR